MSLQKVKERLCKYKEDIDQTEEREIQAKADLLEAESRCEKATNERDGLKRRLVLLREDLVTTKQRLEANEKKVAHAEGRYGEDDEKRQEYELTEAERDEQLYALEEECATAKKLSIEAHAVMVESDRKLTVLEAEVKRTNERLEAAQERVSRLENDINDVGTEIRDLEERDNEAAEREQLSEEKMKFLEEQLKEVDARAEMGEREMVKLEGILGDLRNEIAGVHKKTEAVKEEVQSIEDMADEIDDQPVSRPAKPAPEPVPESDEEPEPEQEPLDEEPEENE